jgi:spoIIIJ-associated protein
MRSVEVEGGSIDDAIERALHALGASRDQVEIDILENATRGVLGIGRRRARVRATMRAPFVAATMASEPAQHAEPAAEPARHDGRAPTASPARSSAPAFGGAGELDVASFLEGALQRMGVTARVNAGAAVDGTCALEIDGSDPRALATCTSEVLAALELVVNRVADRHTTARTRFTMMLAGRGADELPRRARQLAERVRQHRKPVTIDVADEHEQQAWTKALRGERGVSVRSTRDGSRRNLVIVPLGRRRGGGTADR